MHQEWPYIGHAPVKVCEWLVGLDIDGKTVVRTPKARKLWDTLMQKSTNISYDEAAEKFADLYFIAIRGVGQGDTPSPFIWDAFFDILLVALNLGADTKFWVRARGDKLVSLKNLAYADDSLTPCSDLVLLQRKVDIVSAFCMIFGFELSITKKKKTNVYFTRRALLQAKLLASVWKAKSDLQVAFLIYTYSCHTQTTLRGAPSI